MKVQETPGTCTGDPHLGHPLHSPTASPELPTGMGVADAGPVLVAIKELP